MKQLLNKTKSDLKIAGTLRFADTYFSRLKGLMFDKHMDQDSALFFDDCNCVQSCFMNFAIDLIFVDKNFVVQRTCEDFKPWRVSPIVWRANAVIELPGGTLKSKKIDIGDQLYVGG